MDYETPKQIQELIATAKADNEFKDHKLLFVLWVIAYQLSCIAHSGLDVNTYKMD